ncbi:histidyl-tRNA synthetase [Nematocida sp. AWRm77]|nr:histidyl-tRNA synthetase [Nematocida sp. AWRm77]
MDLHILKTAKGTKDYAGAEKTKIDKIIEIAERAYKKRGGVPLDTPVFELKEVLTNKYGEDSKLIYDLADQGGELCSLRYDLTVPFARYLAQTKTIKIKRYQTGKVYRRDQPAFAQGRYREFVQSDFDIVGDYEDMTADAEVVSAACEILGGLSDAMNSRFVLRINHRGLVNSLMEVCGVQESLWKTIGSSIDKLDKQAWEEIAAEMASKGLAQESIEQIKEGISRQGSLELIEELKAAPLGKTEAGARALKDLERLYELLVLYGVDSYVSVDLSLIRGLDYYTGLIMEGCYLTEDPMDRCSVIAGGRYDGLVSSMFQAENAYKKKQKDVAPVKCVGVSLGVTRLSSLIPTPGKYAHTQVLVCSNASNMTNERVRVCTLLRNEGISAEYFMGTASNLARQIEYGTRHSIPVFVAIRREDLEKSMYYVMWGTQEDKHRELVSAENLASFVSSLI